MGEAMQQVGRYQIEGELGRGAMGVVWRAWDPAIGRAVAIKTIRLGTLGNNAERERLRERLLREARSAGSLSHPGIVTIFDVIEDGETVYLVLEHVNGPTLEQMLVSKRTLSPASAVDLLGQVAAALDAAHARGIVHRDIKPDNIMIHDGAQAKITDFGIARMQSNETTQHGTMLGTPNYMAPEQVQGRAIDGRADQYALAVVAFELLTGEKPFQGDSLAALIYRIVHESEPPASRLNTTLNAGVDAVLRRGLSKDPASRYPDCTLFVRALESALAACPGWRPLAPGAIASLPTMAPPPPLPRVWREPEAKPKRGRWLAALLFLLIAGATAAAVGWILLDSRPAPAPPRPAPSVAATTPPPPAPTPTPEAEPPPPATLRPSPMGEAAPATAEQFVQLFSEPPGAEVVFESPLSLKCTTPCRLSLPYGRHALRASLPGYRTLLRILEEPQDNYVTLRLEAITGVVTVRSQPEGAQIVIDGKLRPEATPARLTLPAGRHVIEIHKEGFPRERQVVEVKDGAIHQLEINWNQTPP
jgi:serine/threonine-protein kinase